MADPSPGRDGAAWFADEIKKLRSLIADLQAPSGTQIYNTVEKLAALIDDIQAQLTAFIEDDVEAIADARVAIALASWFAGNVSIGGELFVNGPVTMPNVYTTDITTGPGLREAVWIRDDGRVGHT